MTNAQPNVVKTLVTKAFMIRPSSITAKTIQWVLDRSTRIIVAAQLVYVHTVNMGTGVTRIITVQIFEFEWILLRFLAGSKRGNHLAPVSETVINRLVTGRWFDPCP